MTPLEGINKTTFSIPKSRIQPEKHYIWAVKGKLKSGHYFEAKSQFLIHDH